MIDQSFHSPLANLVPDALILLGILNRGDGNVDRTLPAETYPGGRLIVSPTSGQTPGGSSKFSSYGLFATPPRSRQPSRRPLLLGSGNGNGGTGSDSIIELNSDDETNANALAGTLVGYEQETSYRDTGSRSRRGSEESLSESRKRDWAEAMREDKELEVEEAETAEKRKRVTSMIGPFAPN